MIRLGLRLTLNGGKEAAVRLVITLVAVAIGVGLLLIALSGMNAINAQNKRGAWLNTGQLRFAASPGVPPGVPPSSPGAAHHGHPAVQPAAGVDPLWWRFVLDHYGTRSIDVVDVAATGPNSPVPPGIPRLPGPGQFYASPALTKLLQTAPAAELADRYPGHQVGTIGGAALPAPDSLIIVIGNQASQLVRQPGAGKVTWINTDPGLSGPSGFNSNKLQTILAAGALALLFPVLVFIGTATRLAAARREQRFAAMRLVGSTPRQVAVISAVESSVAGLGGVALGFTAFLLLRPALTNINFTGARFEHGDLSLSLTDILLVVLGVPVAAAVAARIAMRRVQISPLGVSRRVTPPAPRAYRLLPLVAGVVELLYFVAVGHPNTTGSQILAYFTGCLLIMAGLVVAGPWLTMVGSKIMARRTDRPAVLVAGRRLADNPRSAFRSISGLILALFVSSVSIGVITTMFDDRGASSGTVASSTLLNQAGPLAAPSLSLADRATVPAQAVAGVRSITGVEGVTRIFASRSTAGAAGSGTTVPAGGPPPPLYALCSEVINTPAMGRCPPGAAAIVMDANVASNLVGTSTSKLTRRVWPAATLPLDQLLKLPVRGLVVSTDGTTAAIERTRTFLETSEGGQGFTDTLGEITQQNFRLFTELQKMTDVVIAVSLVIAGCSLAVSVTAGVNDRKRPFSLLRLSGVPIRVLRQVVALEAVVPLVLIAIVSAGMGFVAAGLFLRSQLGESLQPPPLDYYLIVAGGFVASLAVIAATLPLIERITGPEVARND